MLYTVNDNVPVMIYTVEMTCQQMYVPISSNEYRAVGLKSQAYRCSLKRWSTTAAETSRQAGAWQTWQPMTSNSRQVKYIGELAATVFTKTRITFGMKLYLLLTTM